MYENTYHVFVLSSFFSRVSVNEPSSPPVHTDLRNPMPINDLTRMDRRMDRYFGPTGPYGSPYGPPKNGDLFDRPQWFALANYP